MKIYIEGHSHKKGYVISKSWSNKECSEVNLDGNEDLKPLRFIKSDAKAKEMVNRWNRRFSTH